MREITLEELLEAGCHFGHQQIRFNPKARDFVFEARDNIHIIDLGKTKEGLEEAAAYIRDLAARGGTLLIVGTKRQAKDIVLKELERVKSLLKDKNTTQGESLFHITTKWIGGVLTNFSQIQQNLRKLEDLEKKLQSDEEKANYTKKEIGLWEKEKTRLQGLYGGIRGMQKPPDALFIIDSHLEDLAVREASNMGVTTVAMVDTNADPTAIDYAIPANDDAVGSIELITSYIMDAWVEGSEAAGRERLRSRSFDKGEAERGKAKDQNKEAETKPEKSSGEKKSKEPVKKSSVKPSRAKKEVKKKAKNAKSKSK